MSASDCPDYWSALDQLHQALVALAKSLGVDPDALVAQFAAASPVAMPSVLTHEQSRSPPKSRRSRTWRAGLYEQLHRDVNQTKAHRNCSIKDAIADLRKDRSGPWWKHT